MNIWFRARKVVVVVVVFFFNFAHTNNYNTLHLQFITGKCYRLQKRNKKTKKDKVHKNTIVYILTIKRRLPALWARKVTETFEKRVLIHLVEGWRHARDDKLVVSLLSTDMSKAFDSLHPPLLLSKLNAYGFESSTVRLLESYLCDRNYRVKIGDLVSSSRTVNRGCPQGSALGPLLWNIFQNDLSYCQ